MTLRRLQVLLLALPDDGSFKTEVRAAFQRAEREAELLRNRDRRDFYERRKAQLIQSTEGETG